MGCPAPNAWTGLLGLSPLLEDMTTSTSSEYLYCSIRGTMPPTGCTSMSMTAILRAQSSLRSVYMEPWATPFSIMSPFMSHACWVLSRVTSMDAAVCSLVQ